jgi:glycosyltransferase involved in cell wall biosynthesis
VPPILTTLIDPPLGAPGDACIETLDRREFSRVGLARLLTGRARDYHAIVLDGSVGLRGGYVDVIAAGMIGHQRQSPPVVLADCTWKRGSWWLDRLACRAGIRAVDNPSITYCTLSTDEARSFPQTWGVDPARVVFTPWCYTLSEGELDRESFDDGGIFAGGDSMRDYDPLIEAATFLPHKITIAATLSGPRVLPPNVNAERVSHDRFVELMRRATVVVVPLMAGSERSGGQQTYLNAMAMGKPVIVTDSPGARDYIRDGEEGLIIPPGNSAALARAIEWVTDPVNRPRVELMRAAGRRAARERFRPQDYSESLLTVVRKALDSAT